MKEKIKKEIKELEERIFLLDMKDHWSHEDFKLNEDLHTELNGLKQLLETME